MSSNVESFNNKSIKSMIQKLIDTYLEGRFIEEDEIIILDKKVYDRCHLRDIGIEFGSNEFLKWKNKNKELFFPYLDAPWQVRKAWNMLEEEMIAKKNVFISLENNLYSNIRKVNGLFCSIRLKTINDYKNLFYIVLNTYKDIYKRSSNNIYKEFIDMLSLEN